MLKKQELVLFMHAENMIKNQIGGINYMVKKKNTETRMDVQSTLMLIGLAVVIIAIIVVMYYSHHA